MHRLPFAPASPQGTPEGGASPAAEGIPVSSGLRIVMGVGFLVIGIVQGIGILRAEDLPGLTPVLEGIGFFLLAGTGIAMLMNRFYSLYLLLVWALMGIVVSLAGGGEVAMPALFARILVALVAIVSVGQRKARPPA